MRAENAGSRRTRGSARGDAYRFHLLREEPAQHRTGYCRQAGRPVRGSVKIVAVTVNADNDELDEIIDLLKPDILQLHGSESPERVLSVKALYGLPVMKAFSIRDADDLAKIDPYIGIADSFLFDAKAPAGSELPGGNGVSFDWSVLHSLDEGVNYMLSGGLNADNVAEALAKTGAGGLDVSSGVESAPGVKDLARIDAFFDAVRSARL